MHELAELSNEKLATVRDDTRESILDKFRRISFMNGNNDVRKLFFTYAEIGPFFNSNLES
jgi:hypothetical protein